MTLISRETLTVSLFKRQFLRFSSSEHSSISAQFCKATRETRQSVESRKQTVEHHTSIATAFAHNITQEFPATKHFPRNAQSTNLQVQSYQIFFFPTKHQICSEHVNIGTNWLNALYVADVGW